MRILSPMPTGSGAIVVHQALARALPGYEVCPYDPRRTYFPPLLYATCLRKSPQIIHTTPDYAIFFRRASVPQVLTFHNFVLDASIRDFSTLAQRLHYGTDLRWLTRKAVAQASVLTSVSDATAKLASRELGLTGDIRVIYNGVDSERFRPRARHSTRNSKYCSVAT